MQRRESKGPAIAIPTQIPESLLALSFLIRKREMELKEEQTKKREESDS